MKKGLVPGETQRFCVEPRGTTHLGLHLNLLHQHTVSQGDELSKGVLRARNQGQRQEKMEGCGWVGTRGKSGRKGLLLLGGTPEAQKVEEYPNMAPCMVVGRGGLQGSHSHHHSGGTGVRTEWYRLWTPQPLPTLSHRPRCPQQTSQPVSHHTRRRRQTTCTRTVTLEAILAETK